MPRTIALEVYKEQMMALRAAALEQQAADGGVLSQAKRQKFQRRIDHIERIFRQRLRDGYFAA